MLHSVTHTVTKASNKTRELLALSPGIPVSFVIKPGGIQSLDWTSGLDWWTRRNRSQTNLLVCVN